MRIYVGNLSYSSASEDLRAAFAEFGSVDSAEIVMDRYTSRSRGFGFVEMGDEEEAKAAIQGLDGTELDGRTLKVNEARPRRSDSQGKFRY